jgi:hypothetical protein
MYNIDASNLHRFKRSNSAPQVFVWETRSVSRGEPKTVLWFCDITRGVWGEAKLPPFGEVSDRYVLSIYDDGKYGESNHSEFASWVKAAHDYAASK